MRGRGASLAALAFLLALAAGYYWKLTLSHGYTWLENPDQAFQVRPWLDFESRELHAGRIPLWDPYQWGGQPLLAQVQPGLSNPLNWPLFAVPLRDGHIPIEVLHWYWVLIHWVAAAFAFWMCRDLGASIAASLVGASVFAFAGFVGNSGTPQFLMSAVWLPVILLFFARVWREHCIVPNAVFCGGALGAAFLSGHHNIPIYTAVLMGGLWLWFLAGHWKRRDAWIALGAFAAVALLICAVQILPAVEYGRQSVRWAGTPEPQHWKDRIPYSVHAEYSLGARSIPGMLVPGLMTHANPFVGVTAVAMALTAIGLGWSAKGRGRIVPLFTAVALGGLCLALGRDTPVHRLAYLLIPMVEKARYPAMAIAISQAGICALTALGIDLWRASARPRAAFWWLVAFGASIFAIYGVLALLHRPPIARPVWVIGCAALLLAAVLRWGRGSPYALLAIALAEAMTLPPPVQTRFAPGSYEQMIAEQSDIADFLRRQPGWFRVEIEEEAVPYNFGDWHGIEQFGGYTASMLERVHRVLGHAPTAAQFGIQYHVARRLANPTQIEVFTSRSGLKVFRDPQVGEPLWTVRNAPCSGQDHIRLVSRTRDDSVVAASLACPGLLAIGDPYYRGWRASVDGKRVPIQELEGVVRAVWLAAGSHRVEFRYLPATVYWGAGCTITGVFIIAICLKKYIPEKHHVAAAPHGR